MEENNPHEEVIAEYKKFQLNCKNASNLILRSLTKRVLRIVLPCFGNPFKTVGELDERYNSRSTATKITTMSDLVLTNFTSVNEDIGLYIDKIARRIDDLANVETFLPKEVRIMLFLPSIEAPELQAVIAAIKTLADDKADWEVVLSYLLEEYRDIKLEAPKS